MNKEQDGAAMTLSRLLAPVRSIAPDTLEAPMVSDVAGRMKADATRDRAVVRTGEEPGAVLPNREARASLLALLLT